MEVAPTREHPTICRCYVGVSTFFDHIGTHGKREHHGVCQGPCESQSTASRKWRSGSILPSCRSFWQLIGVANGLEYLHEHDIVHGDLKGVSPWFGVRLVSTLIDATRSIS